jgi:oligopeptide/dipeptide ABC transporter, ATP-binding protein, C-terminal domain
MSEKKLEVKDLKISFRTNNGKVQAVRNISFDLYDGETLAIIGESGSGKSVTSRAIMGILAGNAVVESGSILYDGKDLLKLKEESFHKIRGDKIAMIFQDPMSSLNPIMKVGKQLTEAMLLKGKTSQRRSRSEFNEKLKLLNSFIDESYGGSLTPEIRKKSRRLCRTFDSFCVCGTKLEEEYNAAKRKIAETEPAIREFLFLLEKKQKTNVGENLKTLAHSLKGCYNVFLIDPLKSELPSLVSVLEEEAKNASGKSEDGFARAKDTLDACLEVLAKAQERERPNFFRIGYYVYRHPSFDLASMEIPELNEKALEFLNEDFLFDFIGEAEKALSYAYRESLKKKERAVELLEDASAHLERMLEDRTFYRAESKKLFAAIRDSIDPLDTSRDNPAYTFAESVEKNVGEYCLAADYNPREERRYAAQKARHDAILAKGKLPDWGVIPLSLIDREALKAQIADEISALKSHYEKILSLKDSYQAHREAIALIDYFKELSSAAVNKITRGLAKLRALKLLEEVGIPNPKVRYNQYPFEFSGGMRQRIVIAIALSANPDILICDEPTTALDVTIQSQILELINRLKEEHHLSVIFITHDLGVVAKMADKIAVMYAGKIVEYGTAEDIFYDPRHPYTWALLSSMPDLDTTEKLEAIPGTPPNMIYPPKGDAFAERNKYAMEIDYEMQPPMFRVADTHFAATWLLHPDAPRVRPPKLVTDRIKRMKNLGEARDGR